MGQSVVTYMAPSIFAQIRAEAVKFVKRHWEKLKEHLIITYFHLKNARSYCYYMKSGQAGTSIEILNEKVEILIRNTN